MTDEEFQALVEEAGGKIMEDGSVMINDKVIMERMKNMLASMIPLILTGKISKEDVDIVCDKAMVVNNIVMEQSKKVELSSDDNAIFEAALTDFVVTFDKLTGQNLIPDNDNYKQKLN